MKDIVILYNSLQNVIRAIYFLPIKGKYGSPILIKEDYHYHVVTKVFREPLKK